MFSASHRDVRRLGAAIFATVLAVSCAVAQESVPGTGSNGTASNTATGSAASVNTTAASSTHTTSGLRFLPNPAKARVRTDRVDSTELTPQPGDFIRLVDKDGHPVWTIYGATIEQFVESLKSKTSAEHNEPAFSISSVSLTGACDDERALLTAKIEIQIERDGVWIAVPIGMQGGYQSSSMHQTGAGEFRQDGNIVYLRGKGLHELFVPLAVPIRRQLNQRHLQLTIPPAAGSQITLRVPKEHCQVKQIEGAHVVASPVPQGTQIDAYGIRGQFDLTWDIPVNEPQARTVFDVASKCTLGMEGDRIQLHAVQIIDAKQGTLPSVRVRMPAGFASIAGEQKDVSDAKKYTAANVDTAGFIKVDLKPTASGRAELTWDLQGPRPIGAPLVIRGFDVEGARAETGEISLIPAEGFHFD